MPNLWDKTPEAQSPPELNPLTNPVLEKNLERWAKVYFGTPPAKRDQAVSALLEEIKRESGQVESGMRESERTGSVQSARPYFATDPKFVRPVCAACQHHNPPGHKFCSRCGQILGRGQTAATGTRNVPEPTDLPLPSSLSHTFPNSTPNSAPTSVPDSGNNTQWVHEQTFSGRDGSYARRGRGRKYVVGLVVIALAAFAYVRWAPEFRARVAPTAASQANPLAPAITRENSSLSGTPVHPETRVPESVVPAAPPAIAPSIKRSSPAVEAHQHTVVPAGIQPASQKSPLLAATTSSPTLTGQEGGAPDLRLAQRYLEGSMGVRDSAEAAKLLWKAVGKENATAAILLSDLYRRGDGVARSCDQARLLLVAAAKRGSAQAAQQLRNLELQGCR